MSNWKELPLNDVIELVIDHRGKTPKKLGFDDFFSEGYPVLSAKHVKTSGLVNLDAMRFANEEMYKKWMKEPTQKGDVILTSEAPLGELFYIDGSKKYVLGQRVFGLRPKSDVLDSMYLLVWLSSAEGQGRLQARATGSTVQGIKQSELLKIMIPIPPMEVQKNIASIYGSLDQKIQLNTQINQTLEQIAQAIFKSWFMDFDPVRAKAAALESGKTQAELATMQAISGKTAEELAQMPSESYAELAEIAKAFPSGFGEDGVPMGWKNCIFGDVAECLDSKRIPLSKQQREKRKGSVPYYGATSVMDYVDEAIFDGIYLLIGEDGSVLKEDGTPFTQYIWGKSWVNNHAHVINGKNGVSTEHLMLFIQQTNITAYITGAVQLKLNQKNMNSIPFIKASNEINTIFAKYIEPLYAKVRENLGENKVLESTRDLLLPRLLNGDL